MADVTNHHRQYILKQKKCIQITVLARPHSPQKLWRNFSLTRLGSGGCRIPWLVASSLWYSRSLSSNLRSVFTLPAPLCKVPLCLHLYGSWEGLPAQPRAMAPPRSPRFTHSCQGFSLFYFIFIFGHVRLYSQDPRIRKWINFSTYNILQFKFVSCLVIITTPFWSPWKSSFISLQK